MNYIKLNLQIEAIKNGLEVLLKRTVRDARNRHARSEFQEGPAGLGTPLVSSRRPSTSKAHDGESVSAEERARQRRASKMGRGSGKR